MLLSVAVPVDLLNLWYSTHSSTLNISLRLISRYFTERPFLKQFMSLIFVGFLTFYNCSEWYNLQWTEFVPADCELCRNITVKSSCLHRASTIWKHFLFFHNDAHNYKITGILKQLKFRRSLRHVSVHAGTVIREPFLCLAKNYSCGSISSSFVTWSM
jgi:hypothetical protein